MLLIVTDVSDNISVFVNIFLFYTYSVRAV